MKFAHQCAFPSNEWDISLYLSSSLCGVRGNFVCFRGSLQKLFIPFFNVTGCYRILIHSLLYFTAMTSWNVFLQVFSSCLREKWTNRQWREKKKKRERKNFTIVGFWSFFSLFSKYDKIGSGFSSLENLMAENPEQGETWRGLWGPCLLFVKY